MIIVKTLPRLGKMPSNCETYKDSWRNEVLHFIWAGQMFNGIFDSFKTLFHDGVIKEMFPNVHLTNVSMRRLKCVTKETVIDFYKGKVYNSCVVFENFGNFGQSIRTHIC